MSDIEELLNSPLSPEELKAVEESAKEFGEDLESHRRRRMERYEVPIQPIDKNNQQA
jgi:hypothetical protein